MNTLNNLIPDFYVALDVVSREMTGFLTSITLDNDVARAAVGQLVRSPVTSSTQGEDIVPASIPPNTGDQVVGNEPITIEKSRAFPFRWTGEEARGLDNCGPGRLTIQQDQIAQAIRAAINEMELYIAQKAALRASRAYGTPGTAPFATTIVDMAQVVKILKDNGAPPTGLNLTIDTVAGLNMRSLANLYKANESGDVALLRQGVLSDLYGAAIRESAGVVPVSAVGTGTGYVVAAGPYAVGATSITLGTGSGTILAGDVLTFQNDPNKYVVKTALTGGVVVLNAPGLRKAHVNGDTVAVSAVFTPNMAYTRNAIVMGIRPPAIPKEGDAADDSMIVTDPRTGISFDLRLYKEYKRVRYELCVAYGGANIKPEHSVLLLG